MSFKLGDKVRLKNVRKRSFAPDISSGDIGYIYGVGAWPYNWIVRFNSSNSFVMVRSNEIVPYIGDVTPETRDAYEEIIGNL